MLATFHSAAFSDPITKVLPVYTELDKNAFFSNEITRFEFVPDQLTLEYLTQENTFRQESSTIEIETDIPETEPDLLFSLILDSNQFICTKANDEIIESTDDMITFNIENNAMEIGEPVDFNFNLIDDNGLKGAKLDANFAFPKVPTSATRCAGQVNISIELTI